VAAGWIPMHPLTHVAGPWGVVVLGPKRAIQFWCANCISQ